MLLCGKNALKQKTAHALLCTCASIQRSKTDVYVSAVCGESKDK
jgi:hypothetical protein